MTVIGLLRAVLSLAMFAGFFVAHGVQLAATTLLVAWLAALVIPPTVSPMVILAVLLPSGGGARSFWTVVLAEPPPPGGLRLSAKRHPQLWTAVTELAHQAGTRPPEEILLTPEVTVSVAERTRNLGLRGGPRRLMLGMPVLRVLTVAELSAVIAQELGQYSRRRTRLGVLSVLSRRIRLSMDGTLRRLPSGNPFSWGFRWYSRLYLLVDNAVRRRQELAADQFTVRVAGKAATAAALRRLPEVDDAWASFQWTYVASAQSRGYYPEDLYGGFDEMMRARPGEYVESVADQDAHWSRWNSHPRLGPRLAAIEAAPEAAITPDDRPARELFTDFDRLSRELARRLAAHGSTLLPWPELHSADRLGDLQEEADHDFRVIARVLRRPTTDLTTVLECVGDGRLEEIAQPLHPTAAPRELPGLFAENLETILMLAAARSGAADWRHSWSEEWIPLVTPDGSEPPLAEIAELAVAPGGLGAARVRLAELGVDIAAATQERQHPAAVDGAVIGGLANTRVNDTEHDVLVLTGGLVLIPRPGPVNKGLLRMRNLVAKTPAEQLAAANDYIAFETVDEAEIIRRVPLRAKLSLADGQVLDLRQPWSGEELPDSRPILTRILVRF